MQQQVLPVGYSGYQAVQVAVTAVEQQVSFDKLPSPAQTIILYNGGQSPVYIRIGKKLADKITVMPGIERTLPIKAKTLFVSCDVGKTCDLEVLGLIE